MRSSAGFWAACVIGAAVSLLATPGLADPEASVSSTVLATQTEPTAPVGVVEFASARGEGEGIRLADALTRRLREFHELEVRSISQSAEVVRATPDAADIRTWARAAGVDAVVAGGVLEGKPATLSIEIRDGSSGAAIAALGVPASESGSWGDAIASLAAQVAGVLARGGEAEPSGVSGLGVKGLLGDLRSEGPFSIESDELEVVTSKGERHLIFHRNVRVVQGDLTLRAGKLDAYYAVESSEPERLVATGDVRLQQGNRRARCDRATYVREHRQIVCSGGARLRQGCDLVRGREIRFDLEREHFMVVGGASVVLQRRPEDADGCSEGRL